MAIVPSQRAVAKVFGVTPKSIQDWIQQGMPGRRGEYDIAKIREWRDSRSRSGSTAKSADTTDLRTQKLEEEVRKLKAEATRAEKTNEFWEGQFIDRHLVENFVSSLNQYVRNELLRLPVEMQSALPAKYRSQLVAEMTDRIRLFLESLASWERRVLELEITEKTNRAGRPKGT